MARHYGNAVIAAGLTEGVRFHDLRHTCAAWLIALGHHMQEVKDHLGHSSIRVTSDRYGHLFPESRDARAASLDNLFGAHSAPLSRHGQVKPIGAYSRKAHGLGP